MSFEPIYDDSYERVLKQRINGKDFFEAFYDKFLAYSEEIREKFAHTDMVVQRGMLKKSFYSLLVFYGSNQADDYIERIARDHDKHHLDIRPGLYDVWLDCLTATLAEYDPLFNHDVELAWRLILAPGITYMKFKHSHI